MRIAAAALVAWLTTLATGTSAEDLLHQPTDGAPPVPLTPSLRAELDDPFFRIVLEEHADVTSLVGVIDLMTEGGLAGFQTFVVGEQIGRPENVIANPEPGCGQPLRRIVISFDGFHRPSGRTLDSNAFISTFMTPRGQGGALEVLGWDESRGTYNYYKMEDGSWRLRNRSGELATADATTLASGCLACHVNGGPIMKEFSFPWNHWHSVAFPASYLMPGSPRSWDVAVDPLLRPRPGQAEQLEQIVQSSLARFTGRLIEERIAVADDGAVTITGLRGLIDSLFLPTELNLVSSAAKSGLDGGGLTTRNPEPMPIPDTFFVNVMQMRDIDLPVFRGQPLVTRIFTPGALGVTLADYEDLLRNFDIDTSCMPGKDTVFAWFGPEPSEFDRRMVERLTDRGVIDRELVAAVLAVDVGEPLFSEARASLLNHVPDELQAASEADITRALRAAIDASLDAVPDDEKSEAETDFASLLASDDAVEALDERVRRLRMDTSEALDPADPDKRRQTLLRLYQRLIDRRDDFESNAISAAQAEFPGLFPQPR